MHLLPEDDAATHLATSKGLALACSIVNGAAEACCDDLLRGGDAGIIDVGIVFGHDQGTCAKWAIVGVPFHAILVKNADESASNSGLASVTRQFADLECARRDQTRIQWECIGCSGAHCDEADSAALGQCHGIGIGCSGIVGEAGKWCVGISIGHSSTVKIADDIGVLVHALLVGDGVTVQNSLQVVFFGDNIGIDWVIVSARHGEQCAAKANGKENMGFTHCVFLFSGF